MVDITKIFTGMFQHFLKSLPEAGFNGVWGQRDRKRLH